MSRFVRSTTFLGVVLLASACSLEVQHDLTEDDANDIYVLLQKKSIDATKHKEGDIFFSHAYDVMADLVAITTGQGIQLLGMMTEAMHNPFLMDRYVALKTGAYVYRAARHLGSEISFRPDGIVASRQREVFDKALHLLEECERDGMIAAIGKARFGDTARQPDGGKGLEGVVERSADYFNPFLEILETELPRLRAGGEGRAA